jgi:hypothetical protein
MGMHLRTLIKSALSFYVALFGHWPGLIRVIDYRFVFEFLGQLRMRVRLLLRGVLGQNVRANAIKSVAELLRPVASSSELIRIGGTGDGGYLVPDDLLGISACFSPGIANNVSFEKELAGLGISSYMADHSVDGPPEDSEKFDFEKLYLNTESDGVMNIRLKDWVELKAKEPGDLILQMDIEGSEWEVLMDTPMETLSRFRLIVIEFHRLDQMLTSHTDFEVVKSVFTRLRQQFSPVHLHANNCFPALSYQGLSIPRVLEVTFLRNDRLTQTGTRYEPQIPHPLDEPNTPYKEVVLTREWTGLS